MSMDLNSEVAVCLLCNSDQLNLKHKGNYRSRVSSQVISICTKYLPEEITGRMNAEIDRQILESIDSPIFCYFCFENSWMLSKLNSQLEEIQSQISKHVAVMIMQANEHKEKMKVSSHDSERKNSSSKLDDSSTDSCDENSTSEHIVEIEDDVKPIICIPAAAPQRSSSTENPNVDEQLYKKNRCGYCSKAFTCSSNLSKHIQSSHQDKREHFCGKCGEAFQRSSQLIIHTVNVHNDSRSLLCGTCGKSFNHLNELQNHKVLEHSKKQKCRECGQSFEHLVHLQEHLRTHDNTVTKVVPVTPVRNHAEENYINPGNVQATEPYCWVDGETEISQVELQDIKIEVEESVIFKTEPDN